MSAYYDKVLIFLHLKFYIKAINPFGFALFLIRKNIGMTEVENHLSMNLFPVSLFFVC